MGGYGPIMEDPPQKREKWASSTTESSDPRPAADVGTIIEPRVKKDLKFTAQLIVVEDYTHCSKAS